MKQLVTCVGSTESGLGFMTDPDDSIDTKTSTDGKIFDNLEAKIIDNDGGLVPFGTPGQLCLRGFSLMKNYWQDEEATKQTIDSEGWCKTGDLARLNEQGYVKIIGRVKDVIVRGGEKVFPGEVENVIMQHPNVLNCQVIGVPNETFEEETAAVIKLKDPSKQVTKEEIFKSCRENLAYFKSPKFVKFTDDIPITTNGKIQKFKLRENLIEELKNPELYELYRVR